MRDSIENALKSSAIKAGINNPVVHLEHPEDISHGDYTTNIAMMYAKSSGISPRLLAEKIVDEFKKENLEYINSIDIAGPGFINIKIADSFFSNKIIESLNNLENIGKNEKDKGKKIMVEYTDPNPFKIFHIGHLMTNTIGESLSRIIEFSGADVIRACYQGDVGLHVAKTVWAIMQNIDKIPTESTDIESRIRFLGEMYVLGENKYTGDDDAKAQIISINKKIFEKSDAEINKIYEAGRTLSLEYFDTIYAKLGTKFNNFYFESEVADNGVKVVKEFLNKGIFENSDGAVVFPGEKYGEHTRVFINSQGLPTYEAKEIGLTMRKFSEYPDLSESIVITANEQNAYFKVIISAMNQIDSSVASKMKHFSHGILRPSTGKMSSRKGNIISAEELIAEFESLVDAKLSNRELDKNEYDDIRKSVAISGLKYTILRQALGGDIIYDPDRAVSFEGDSGPYLQYAVVRAQAVLNKARELGIEVSDISNANNLNIALPEKVELLEKLLIRFGEVVERARLEYSPQYIVTYLLELSSAFNSYYTNNKIVDSQDKMSPYRIQLTKVFIQVMKNGLWILGIRVPNKM